MSTFCTATTFAAKQGPTYYTADRVATAKRNVEQFEWARTQLGRIRNGDPIRYYNGPEYGRADRGSSHNLTNVKPGAGGNETAQ